MLLEEEARLEVVVESGIGAVSGTKALSHVAEGTVDCARTKGWLICLAKGGGRCGGRLCVGVGVEEFVAEVLGEGGNEDVALPPGEVVQEGVIGDADVLEEKDEAVP